MYYYAKKDGSDFGVTLEQLRVRLQLPDMPAETTDIGEWFGYVGKDCPQVEWYQYCREVFPVDGVMTWEVITPEPDVLAQMQAERLAQMPANVRARRNILLRKYVDSIGFLHWETMSSEEQQAWRDFRQALLDIPQQEGFPENVVWPELPDPNFTPIDVALRYNRG